VDANYFDEYRRIKAQTHTDNLAGDGSSGTGPEMSKRTAKYNLDRSDHGGHRVFLIEDHRRRTIDGELGGSF